MQQHGLPTSAQKALLQMSLCALCIPTPSLVFPSFLKEKEKRDKIAAKKNNNIRNNHDIVPNIPTMVFQSPAT